MPSYGSAILSYSALDSPRLFENYFQLLSSRPSKTLLANESLHHSKSGGGYLGRIHFNEHSLLWNVVQGHSQHAIANRQSDEKKLDHRYRFKIFFQGMQPVWAKIIPFLFP